MYSIETLKELMFMGAPILLNDIFIYPISIKDRIKLGTKYNKYLNLLCMSDEDLEEILNEKFQEQSTELQKITPFEYLLLSAEVNENFLLELKQAFSTFLREDVLIIPAQSTILVGTDISQERIINKDNFPEIQKILRLQNHLEEPEEIPENEHPMHKKFRLRRKQVKEAKAKQAASGDGPKFIDLMSSMCVMNIGITWKNIGEMPLFTFYELLNRSQMREKYDTDTKALLAGADSKKIKLQYWIRDNSVEE